MKIKLMRETWWLAIISIVDLILTLWLIDRNLAAEANPIMQMMLGLGVGWFILFKCFCTFGPLAALEALAKRHQTMVRKYLRLGILAYASCHIGGIGAALYAANFLA